MPSMKDLLGDTPYEARYPIHPGFKEPTTSRKAAEAAARRSSALRDLALAAIIEAGAGGLTADEVADRLNMSVLAIRPRVSELRKLGQVEGTGSRRKNVSGLGAKVWRARCS